MADAQAIWVCAGCRSVNKLRAKQCYNCRTPKHRAAVDPSQIDPTTKGQIREIALPAVRSSRRYAVVATILIVVIGILHAVTTMVGVTLLLRLIEGDLGSEGEIVGAALMGLTTTGVALIALIAWAVWLSKVVRVMPALGLGYPPTNGLMAFVENFIPVFNLWRVPAIVRDIVWRLEPGESRGGTLITAAWVGLIVSFLLPRIGGLLNSFASQTFESYVRNVVIIGLVSLGFELMGSIILVVVIWWIEGRISRHPVPAPTAVAASGVVPGATTEEPASPEALEPSMTPEPDPESYTGPRLDLTVALDGSMVATLDGESETITIEDLLETATALARADGSAVVGFGDGTPEASAVAGQAMRILADAGVLATADNRRDDQTTG